ncbi:MAG: DUF5113 domain-containing protein [Prevotella sp.]|nr:DUF5113 domain-containing protein [Prevotella sp.]
MATAMQLRPNIAIYIGSTWLIMAMWSLLLCTPAMAQKGTIAYEVLQMDSCRMRADSKEFYLHKYNFDKHINNATPAEQIQAQLIYADFLLQMRQFKEARAVVDSVALHVAYTDSLLFLNYLYHQGKVSFIPVNIQKNKALIQKGYDALVQCYILSTRRKIDEYRALSMQALSMYFSYDSIFAIVRAYDAPSVRYINEYNVPDSLLAGNLAERTLSILLNGNNAYLIADAWRNLSSCYFRIGEPQKSVECLNMALAIPAIDDMPELKTSIAEQMSLSYSAMDDKFHSDYYRNMYLDLQDSTRQDRQLEARVLALNQTTSRIWILVYIACGVFILLLISVITLIHNHKANKIKKADFEELEEKLALMKLENTKSIRAMVEQRACVQVINGMLPLIERMGQAAKNGKMDYCQELAHEINRQNNMLTEWIKMRRGDIRPHIENVNLSDIFSVIKKTSTSTTKTNIKADSSAVVKADKALTLFLVNTLVDNARKSGATEIDVNATTGSNYAEISVTDNGKGMTEEQLAHLFEYKQIDGKGGFGLQNCRGIIDRYKKISSLFSVCMISAKSALGKGTTISFRLPLIKSIVIALVSLLSISMQAKEIDRYADSLYNCNIQGRYSDALLYADSCRAHSADADSIVLLSVYNEEAVASLAMHQWTRYFSSNWQYTLLYRELTADKSLPDYYRSMQRAELQANIAMLVVLILILSLIPLVWYLYLKPIVIQRRKERERRNNLEEEIAALRQENERLHVTSSITDNQLSTVKHETMYYPSRILQLISSNAPQEEISNAIEYYRELCLMLTSKVLKQKPMNSDTLQELRDFLQLLIKRHKEDPLTEEQVSRLFTIDTPHTDYLVMRQIMREIGEITHNRNSGITATYQNGKTQITLNS